MSILLRRPTAEDAPPIADLSRRCAPHQTESAAFWQKASEDAIAHSGFWIATTSAGASPVGYGYTMPDLPGQPETGKYRVHLAVDPEQRRRGAGSALYQHLAGDLDRLGARIARVRIHGSDRETMAFAGRRGFREYHRMVYLERDLSQPGPELGGLIARARLAGVDFTDLATAAERHTECWPEIYELQNACFAGVPSVDPFVPPTREAFDRSMQDPLLLRECFFLARQGGRLIGLAYAARLPERPDTLGHRFTGVHPDFTGQGAAKALKALVSRWAAAHGYRRITTATATVNKGMLAVNLALGFTRQYEVARLQKDLAGPAQEAG